MEIELIMKYNHNWINEKLAKGEEIEYIFFWGHQPKKNGEISKSCFSQWFERVFEHEGITYPTAEHWMMAGKAKLFKDKESLEEVIKSKNPKDVKAIGRKVKNFNEADWLENRERIVEEGNYLKFIQHDDLWTFLDSTADKVIVEASPYDKVWGIGLKSDFKGIENPDNWDGLNLLGYALMEIRDKIRSEKG